MNIELTDSQSEALDTQADGPARVIDPRTKETYVLLKLAQYERIRALFEDTPLSLEEQRRLLHAAGKRAGWDDAEMDVYNELDPRKP